jgi:hypothetical protein
MGIFFSNPTNLRVVEQSMNRLLEAMSKIDTDRSLRLTKSLLFFRQSMGSQNANFTHF